MIKRLIFDVDDTLITGVDFKPHYIGTFEKSNLNMELLDKFSFVFDEYELRYDHYSEKDFLKFLEEYLNVKLPSNFINIFFDELQYCIPPKNQKLIDTIEKLSKKYELVLLTNFFGESQLNRLNNMGIGKYFKEFYGEKKLKPAPESYTSACGKYAYDECVMIGDSFKFDIDGARKLGLHTIFVNTKKVSNVDPSIVTVDKVEDIDEHLIESLEK